MEALQDGFVNGQDDVWAWLKVNIMDHNLKSCPPNMDFVADMKTTQIILMMKQAYGRYNETKNPQPVVEEKKDEEMKNEEVKEEVKEETEEQKAEKRRQVIYDKYKSRVEQDKKFMEKMEEQNPLSRAYQTTCSFTKGKKMTVEEAKLQVRGYHADQEKKLNAMSASTEVKEIIRKNLITGGGFPQAKVDDIFSSKKEKPVELPESLVKAFLNLQKATIKFRLSEDEDYKAATKSGST